MTEKENTKIRYYKLVTLYTGVSFSYIDIAQAFQLT